ncbi:DoxX family protein [Nocardiopsis synnemataformans]|uniref:DoxX family protein n=1 Tax=Nocardiopsis synnemataformans TaxID=61305 RepID=UPI003EB7E133
MRPQPPAERLPGGGIGLVLYFIGAVVTVVRARSYAHIPFPLVYAAPVAASLVVL